MITQKEALSIYQKGARATVAKLLELDRKVSKQNEKINELEKKIRAISNPEDPKSDSPSTPSGMKPVYTKSNIKRRRRRPGRKRGHEGARRKLPERVDQTEDHTLECCPNCGNDKLGKPFNCRERYTEDLPPVTPIITKHNISQYWCDICKDVVEEKVVDALPKSTIGLKTLVMTAWLHFFLGVTIKKIISWMKTFSQFEVTAGGLSQSWHRLAEILLPQYQEIGVAARESSVLNADETGWRVNGKTHWLWCFANRNLVFYLIDKTRGSPVVKEVLGEFFKGILIADFYGAYNAIVAFAKQRCITHLLGELKKVSLTNRSKEWRCFCKKLKRLLKDGLRLKIKEGKLKNNRFERKRVFLQERLEKIYEGHYRDLDCRRLVKRLKRHKDEIFTFLDYPEVTADNNHAERMMRPPVIARKNSFCNRSDKGALTQAVLMSIFRTYQMRNIDPVAALISVLEEWIQTENCPHLPNSNLIG